MIKEIFPILVKMPKNFPKQKAIGSLQKILKKSLDV